MEKEGKERDEKGRKTWLEMQSITEQLRVLRKSAEKVQDEEKRKKFEGFGDSGLFGGFGGFKQEKRKIKPIKGLVLKKDRDGEMMAAADAFFEESGKSFGGKAGSPIASGSTVPAKPGTKFAADAVWQMEFGYRP